MLDTREGQRTQGSKVLAVSDVPEAAPHDENLREIEKNLGKLAKNTDRDEVLIGIIVANRRFRPSSVVAVS